MRPGVKSTFTSTPASLAAFSTAAAPPSTIRSASDTFLPPVWNSFWIASSLSRTVLSSAGLLTAQSFWGASRTRAPLAPPRLSVPRKVEAEAQAAETSCETVRPEPRIFALSAAASASPMVS